jgi:hypothetical protein
VAATATVSVTSTETTRTIASAATATVVVATVRAGLLLLVVSDDLLVVGGFLPRLELIHEPRPHQLTDDEPAVLLLHPVGGLVQFTGVLGLLSEDLEESVENLRSSNVRAQDGNRGVLAASLQHLLVAAHLLPAVLHLLHQAELLRRAAGQLQGVRELERRLLRVGGPGIHVGVVRADETGQIHGHVGHLVAEQRCVEATLPDLEPWILLDGVETGALGGIFDLDLDRGSVDESNTPCAAVVVVVVVVVGGGTSVRATGNVRRVACAALARLVASCRLRLPWGHGRVRGVDAGCGERPHIRYARG